MSSEDRKKPPSPPRPDGEGAPTPGKESPAAARPDPDAPNVPDWAREINPDLPATPKTAAGPPAPPGAAEPQPGPSAPSQAATPAKGATPAPKGPPTPPPAKPAAGAAKASPPPAKPPGAKGPEMQRREFLNWLALGWIAFSAASAAGLTAMGRFFFPNVLFEPPSIFRVGFPNDFAEGQVDLRFKEKFRVWVIREGNTIYALLAKCTHLGCTPNWLAAENKFKCPCHGSGFYRTGINFEGPAPRPLERVKITLGEDGQILLDKGIVYQQEKGQWNDPSSFLTV